MKRQLRNRQNNRRGAILSMELILVLPIFLLLLFAIVEFSLLTQAQSRISDAAHVGARKICLANVPASDVRADIEKSLGPKLARGIQVEVNDLRRTGESVHVRVLVPMQNAAPDLLWMTGFSVRHRVLAADALMVREHDIVSAGQGRL